MHVSEIFFKLIDIDNLAHRSHCKPAHVRVHHDRLCFGITYYAYSAVARKVLYVIFKLVSEITILQTVNGSLKSFFFG